VIDQLDTLMNIRDKLQEDEKLYGKETLNVLETSIESELGYCLRRFNAKVFRCRLHQRVAEDLHGCAGAQGKG